MTPCTEQENADAARAEVTPEEMALLFDRRAMDRNGAVWSKAERDARLGRVVYTRRGNWVYEGEHTYAHAMSEPAAERITNLLNQGEP